MATKGQCFIVMPITTPDSLMEIYRDGEEHFQHVLECLFIPAIEKAGYTAVPPKAKGADLIHAEIINNLETAEIVLCDMSTLNPNVFFEFGIRTSLNKPVCILKDELTVKVPFDTTIINYHGYSSSIEPWELQKQIDEISNHIIESFKRSKGSNDLWKYFGFTSEAQPSKSENDESSKLDYLMRKVDSLRDALESVSETRASTLLDMPISNTYIDKDRIERVQEFIVNSFPDSASIESVRVNTFNNVVTISYSGSISGTNRTGISNYIMHNYGIRTKYVHIGKPDMQELNIFEDNAPSE
ncbi:hypothetical protein ACFLYQ_02775 [Chloroflexota bacterium]